MKTSRGWMVAGLFLMPLVLQAQEAGQRPRTTDREPAGREQAGREQPGREQPGRAEAQAGTRAEGQVGGRTELQTTREARGSGQLDHYIITCLKGDNQNEVTISKLAAQRASHPDVKAFAQQMVKEHSEELAKLEQIDQSGAGSRGGQTTIRTETRTQGRQVSNPADADTRDTPRREGREATATTQPPATTTDRDPARPRTDRDAAVTEGARPRADVRVETGRTETSVHARGASGGLAQQLMQIKQEISEKSLATAQRELSSKQGIEFDKCYIGMQIAAHYQMVDSLAVLTNHTSGELQQVIDESHQTAQQHLEHAKRLMEKLEGASASTDRSGAATSTTRKPESAK